MTRPANDDNPVEGYDVTQAADEVKRHWGAAARFLLLEKDAEIERLRATIVRAKDALLDGQSTQWVHDLLVSALKDTKP